MRRPRSKTSRNREHPLGHSIECGQAGGCCPSRKPRVASPAIPGKAEHAFATPARMAATPSRSTPRRRPACCAARCASSPRTLAGVRFLLEGPRTHRRSRPGLARGRRLARAHRAVLRGRPFALLAADAMTAELVRAVTRRGDALRDLDVRLVQPARARHCRQQPAHHARPHDGGRIRRPQPEPVARIRRTRHPSRLPAGLRRGPRRTCWASAS